MNCRSAALPADAAAATAAKTCKSLASTPSGLRPRFVLPARKLHPSKRLTLDQLALVETLGIGCHAVNRGAPQAGENVLVVGAGPIGLSVIEFVKLTGATITVLDLNQKRLDFCKGQMGVAHTVRFTDEAEVLKGLMGLTDGALYPVVFDATGSPKSMCNAFNYVAHTGRLVFVGIVVNEISFPDPLLHRREMTLFASRNAAGGLRPDHPVDRRGPDRHAALDHAPHGVRRPDRQLPVVHEAGNRRHQGGRGGGWVIPFLPLSPEYRGEGRKMKKDRV